LNGSLAPLSNHANLTVFFDKNEVYLFSLWRFPKSLYSMSCSADCQAPRSPFTRANFLFQRNEPLRTPLNKT
jgi:hypothetical protein